MNVLVACEESQAVCIAFREKGHSAFSCDIQESSGGYPEWHLQMDVFEALKLKAWDLVIAFPPCTHLASSGAVYWPEKQKDGRQQESISFVLKLYDSCDKVCIENPSGILSTVWMKPTQIIHPYLFGDPYKKRTCLWLKNLPPLEIKNNLFYDKERIVTPIAAWHSGSTRGGIKKDGTRTKSKLPALKSGSKMRSKTFPGIAQAMAEQWG